MLRSLTDEPGVGYQFYKLAGAAWIVFVVVYLPLVLLTGTFTIVPDTWPELAVLIGLTLMGGIGPRGPNEEREHARHAERSQIQAMARADAARDFINEAATPPGASCA